MAITAITFLEMMHQDRMQFEFDVYLPIYQINDHLKQKKPSQVREKAGMISISPRKLKM
jgi:hypothetical protein